MAVSEPARYYDTAPRKALVATAVAPTFVVVTMMSRRAIPAIGRTRAMAWASVRLAKRTEADLHAYPAPGDLLPPAISNHRRQGHSRACMMAPREAHSTQPGLS